VEYPDDLANSWFGGRGLLGSGDVAKAIEAFQEARSITEPIVAAHRQRIDYRRELARLYTDLGNASGALKDRSEAERWHQKSLDLLLELQQQHALWMSEINQPKLVETKTISRTIGR